MISTRVGGSSVQTLFVALLASGCGHRLPPYWEAVTQLRFDDAAAAPAGDFERGYAAALDALTQGGEPLLEGLEPAGSSSQNLNLVADLRARHLLATSAYDELARYPGVAWLSAFSGARDAVAFESPATLPLQSFQGRWWVVTVRVDGVETPAVLDTGAAFTTITRRFAETHGVGILPLDAAIGTSTSQDVQADGAVLRHVEAGGARWSDLAALVLETDAMTFVIEPDEPPVVLDFVLGWNALREVDLTVDLDAKEVRFREPGPREGDLLRWYIDPLVRARTPDGAPLVFALDTGALHSHLTERGAVRMGARGPMEPTSSGGAGGEERYRARRIEGARLFVGADPIALPKVYAHGDDRTSLVRLDGTLGLDAVSGAARICYRCGIVDLAR